MTGFKKFFVPRPLKPLAESFRNRREGLGGLLTSTLRWASTDLASLEVFVLGFPSDEVGPALGLKCLPDVGRYLLAEPKVPLQVSFKVAAALLRVLSAYLAPYPVGAHSTLIGPVYDTASPALLTYIHTYIHTHHPHTPTPTS